MKYSDSQINDDVKWEQINRRMSLIIDQTASSFAARSEFEATIKEIHSQQAY
jgi:hypothetical protein